MSEDRLGRAYYVRSRKGPLAAPRRRSMCNSLAVRMLPLSVRLLQPLYRALATKTDLPSPHPEDGSQCGSGRTPTSQKEKVPNQCRLYNPNGASKRTKIGGNAVPTRAAQLPVLHLGA